MSVSAYKTFADGEVLTAADLNASFAIVTGANGQNASFPRTATADFDGFALVLDADGDSSLRETSDDVIALKLQGQDLFIFDGDAASAVNGLTFTASATGSAVAIGTQGSDSNINLLLDPKGTGGVDLDGATLILDADADSSLRETADDIIALRLHGSDVFIFDGATSGTVVDGVRFYAASSGDVPIIRAQGASTNVGLKIESKGTGLLYFNGAALTATPSANNVPIASAGGTLDSWVSSSAAAYALLATYSPSAAASVDITSVISATYSSYEIEFALRPASTANLHIRTDASNGASFDTSSYFYARIEQVSGTVSGASATAAAAIVMTGNVATNVGRTAVGRVRLHHVGSATHSPTFTWQLAYGGGGDNQVVVVGSGQQNAQSAINAVQLFFSTDNITSGTVRVYGLKAA